MTLPSTLPLPLPKRGMALVAAGLAVAGLVGACGSGEDRPGQASACGGTGSVSSSGAGGETDLPFAAKETDTKVEVVLQDYGFGGLPSEVQGPNVVFDATVKGSNCHELEVLDADGKPVGEIPAFPAGEEKVLGVELQPGTYTVQCLVKEGKVTHADLGMKATLTVT
jgi:hypothetical protein